MQLNQLGFNQYCSEYFSSVSDADCHPARVSFASRNRWRLLSPEGEAWASLPGKARLDGEMPTPVVGDWVAARRVDDGLSVIHGVMPRQSWLARGSTTGRKTRDKVGHADQVLVANVTKCLIVCGLDRDFNPRRIERYVAMAFSGAVTPIVVLNKADLCENIPWAEAEASLVAPGVEIVTVSALDGQGMSRVCELLGPDDTSCLLGSSGAGKSTLLNALAKGERRLTGEVSDSTGKGRHTTTDRELFALGDGGLVIDTPGLREVSLADGDGLDGVFPEIGELAAQCRFADCSHEAEPGCAVLRAVEEGRITPDRWASYLKLKKEAAFRRRSADVSLAVAERKKWKSITKDIRRYFRNQ